MNAETQQLCLLLSKVVADSVVHSYVLERVKTSSSMRESQTVPYAVGACMQESQGGNACLGLASREKRIQELQRDKRDRKLHEMVTDNTWTAVIAVNVS